MEKNDFRYIMKAGAVIFEFIPKMKDAKELNYNVKYIEFKAIHIYY